MYQLAIVLLAANLLPNPSFEQGAEGGPAEWAPHTWGGQADFAWDRDVAHGGAASLRISSSEGADADWHFIAHLRPQTWYRLSGWIRTRGLRPVGDRPGRGALLNLHGWPVATGAVTGDSDWTQVSAVFLSQDGGEARVDCLFGGWGLAAGTAWFDDVVLAELGGDGRFTLAVDPTREEARVDPLIYGQFLEHIYSSVVDGLWGEQVCDPSFEDTGNAGLWAVTDGEIVQDSAAATDCHLEFGDPSWTDYELSLEARKLGGAEGFLIVVRAADERDFYWWNLGGWGNREHGLESEVNEQRGTVGEHLPGRIETDRWYRIRLRVEGDHIRGWLDDDKLLDLRDGSHPKGAVGVGTWRTRAAFRGFRVTSLDGRVLLDGLPDLKDRVGMAQYWEPYQDGGQVECSLDGEDPLNSRVSQRMDLDAPDGWAGLRQGRFSVAAGETYDGSLWLRSDGFRGEGKVRLVAADGRVLAEAPLEAPADHWRRAGFHLLPSARDTEASLVIAFRGRGRVWVDQVSLVSEAARQAGGLRPDLLQAIADLEPSIIRWPGGCFASIYRWKTSIGPRHRRTSFPNTPWGGMDHGQFGTDEFVDLCRRVGAEPLIVINSGSWDDLAEPEYLQDALDWVEYCNGPADSQWGAVRARNGHPEPYGVGYWEIDNETWGMGVEKYAEVVKRFSEALRAKDPSIVIFACGSAGYDRTWSTRLVDLCGESFDYLSWHHYEGDNGYAEGPRRLEQAWEDVARHIASSPHPDIRTGVTEWNLQTTDWRTGLFAGGFLIAAERQSPAVSMATPALFLRNVDAPAWDNAFINFDHARWFPAPNYVVLRLFRRCFGPVRVALSGLEGGPLDAVATRSEDGRRVFVKMVNSGPRELAVAVELGGGWTPRRAELRYVTAESLTARNTLDQPDAIREQCREVTAQGRTEVRLPAASVSVLCLER